MADRVIVVAGPTASGKTKLSIELAKKLNGEIVSADSMQIYKGMDIGTAKADSSETGQIPHHMLDVAEPWEEYSVARYVDEASACCNDIISRGKIPVITGGTGLYIDSLLSGRSFAERQTGDNRLRDELSEKYDAVGGEAMLRELRQIDPCRAEKLSPADKRRIVRALEIYMLTGITATEHDRRTRELPKAYDACYFVLNFKDRADLYERIDKRVDIMAGQGLFDEVKGLLASGLSENSTAMQAIGYKEVVASLKGEMSSQEALELIKQSSRRYAKRQLTWFRRNQEAFRLELDCPPDYDKALSQALDYIGAKWK